MASSSLQWWRRGGGEGGREGEERRGWVEGRGGKERVEEQEIQGNKFFYVSCTPHAIMPSACIPKVRNL